MCISRAIMHSTYFSILVLVTSLKSCSSFLVPSSGPRQATGLPRHMFRSEVLPFPRTRGQETARKATNEGDDDGVDYSADPITAFLGKFLPSGKEESTTPQAEDLVSLGLQNRIPPHSPLAKPTQWVVFDYCCLLLLLLSRSLSNGSLAQHIHNSEAHNLIGFQWDGLSCEANV